jgi:hypothetical protein
MRTVDFIVSHSTKSSERTDKMGKEGGCHMIVDFYLKSFIHPLATFMMEDDAF